MPEKWLDGYGGQSLDELIALAGDYRVDSIVLAVEDALLRRSDELNEPELTVLAVEALEREVNNGGYHQFFLNTPEHAPVIVGALQRIGCPETARITTSALGLLGLAGPVSAEAVSRALENDAEGKLVAQLSDACDGPYYDASEPIAERLFEYLKTQRGSIRLQSG